MSKDKHNNNHRIGKSRFDCTLTTSENDEILRAIELTGVRTKKELLLLLVERNNKGLLNEA